MFIADDNFKFDVFISNDYYEYRDQLIWASAINHYSKHSCSINELISFLKRGHLITCVAKERLYNKAFLRRSEECFTQTNMLLFDIDGSIISLGETISKLKLKPTFSHTSSRHKGLFDSKGLNKFHLFYILDEPITSPAEYHELWGKIYDDLTTVVNDESIDKHAMYTWFAIYGNPSDWELYKSNLVYSKNDISSL